jgi:glucose/arabinose dehydrogenase
VTLKGGQLKRWQAGKGLSDPIVGVPKVWANGQGGLLDVVLAPDFETSRRVWLSYAEAGMTAKPERRWAWPPERRLFPH